MATLSACDSGGAGGQMNLRAEPATQAVAEKVDVSMRWTGRAGSDAWTQATLDALDQHGVTIMSRVPSDVSAYCPAYADQGPEGRRAFWAGFMSAVAKHESTYNPGAKGGGGRWLGLMQISPATWRHYGCDGKMLDGADNMVCAVKIMTAQVGRDNAVVGGSGAWRGVARDWAPLRNASKRADIANWTSQQSYCAKG
ncbi:lytic transglycosylase domain-containing protein [Paracoccus sp. (in: a-proteobacteria)]|uniref:lytic transglycosylase domain-containing protein n=1 Tax=Paracoccus sp. TaxID=267 RepID=UPI0026DFCCB1|nr:lytic transglycosylase domain-containing protein [Paracoccus sp. (in: a-proteobacteria)]